MVCHISACVKVHPLCFCACSERTYCLGLRGPRDDLLSTFQCLSHHLPPHTIFPTSVPHLTSLPNSPHPCTETCKPKTGTTSHVLHLYINLTKNKFLSRTLSPRIYHIREPKLTYYFLTACSYNCGLTGVAISKLHHLKYIMFFFL